MKIAVLGATGMLGSMLVRYLRKHFQVVATVRSERHRIEINNVETRTFEAFSEDGLAAAVGDCQWVINAIGVIPQRYEIFNNLLVSYEVNSELPAWMIGLTKCQVIQIATDCVYSGKRGSYTEGDIFSPVDDYGESKLLGEVESPNIHHLRCSIVGREPFGPYSLLGWFLSQPQRAVIKGYVNHQWNGVTTHHFAKICRGIIENSIPLPHMQHLVPADSVSKYELLKLFASEFGREDIAIKPVESEPIDRTLATAVPALNQELWRVAGYDEPPTIAQMVKELADNFGGLK